jgi:hypothetical protein
MSVLHINNITNKEGTGGPTIAGITTVDSTGFMRVPVGDTRTRLVNDYENIVTDGLVLHLDAGRAESFGGDGTTWRDLSGNNNNGTLQGGVGFTVDDGGSLIFDGTNDYIPFNNTITLTGSYTISYAIYTTRTGSNTKQQWLFDVGGGGSGITLYGWSSGLVAIRDSSNAQRYTWNVLYDNEIRNNFCILDFVSNGTTIEFYLNNISRGIITPASVNFNINMLGTDRFGDNQAYDGKMYYARYYNRALSAAEISQNYNALVGRYI